jgi:hypothetical protein
VPLRGVARLAGGTAVEVAAELFRCQREPGRTAVDDAADRRPVALANVVTVKIFPNELLDTRSPDQEVKD